ncbi:hypothetical protein ACWEFL_35880 [Streptomyces sp. NPDC004838]
MAMLQIFVHAATVIPLTSTGVTAEEREARRRNAYSMAAIEELPHLVREAGADVLSP